MYSINTKGNNLLSLMHDQFKEHEVILTDGKKTAKFYLIEYHLSRNLIDDFESTYKPLNNTIELAERLMNTDRRNVESKKNLGHNLTEQVYGVLIDKNLQNIYAFNRQFADLSKDKTRLVFKPAKDILLDLAGPKPDIESEMDDYVSYNSESDGMSMRVRYALLSKKRSTKPQVDAEIINFGMPNLLNVIKENYEKNNRITVILDGEKNGSLTSSLKTDAYLIKIKGESKTVDDFLETYKGQLNNFKTKTAKKIFTKKKTENEYGVILDTDLKAIWVFNTEFAVYVQSTSKLAYKDPEQILMDVPVASVTHKKGGVRHIPHPSLKRIPPRGRGGRGVMKYALLGKKE
ncbi:hypothetical protein HN510_03540, partial [Candidatus Woesearchaeota archaeon]|nr:hypothetical protein [Candidatus Woesearchaeota archaeon]